MPSDLSNLNLHTEDYNGTDQVLVGNGKGLKTHHIGNSLICFTSKSFFSSQYFAFPTYQKGFFCLSISLPRTITFTLNHPSFSM